MTQLTLPSAENLFRPESDIIQVKSEHTQQFKPYLMKNVIDYTQFNVELRNCPKLQCRGLATLEATHDLTGLVCNRCATYYDCPTYLQAYDESEEAENVPTQHQSIQNRVERSMRQMNVVDSKEYSNLQRMTAGEAIIDQCYGYPNGISLQMRNCASDLLKQFIVNRPLRVNNMYAAVFACITIASQQLPNSRIYDSKLISYIFPIETKIGDMNKSIRRYMKEIQQIAKLPELTKEQQIEKNINVLCNRIQNPMLCSQYAKRIDQQKQILFKQMKNNMNLRARSPLTVAASIICAALQKLNIDYNGTTKRITAQWCSHLSGVSHGRIQSTVKLMKRIDNVIQS